MCINLFFYLGLRKWNKINQSISIWVFMGIKCLLDFREEREQTRQRAEKWCSRESRSLLLACKGAGCVEEFILV